MKSCFLISVLVLLLGKTYSQISPPDSLKTQRVMAHPKTPNELLMGKWVLEDIKYNGSSVDAKNETFDLLSNSNRWMFLSNKLVLTNVEGTRNELPYTFVQWLGIGSLTVENPGKQQFLLEIEQISNDGLKLFYGDKTISFHFIKETI